LGSLGLDFGGSTSTSTNGTNTKVEEKTTQNTVKHTVIQLFFDLPILRGDATTMDPYEIREQCDPIINNWFNDGTEKKNLRMLLATLHEIWKGENWTKVCLGDILEDKQLKKAYSKAILQIHPDKVHSTNDPRMKYCAERVCNILTDAYSDSKK